MAEYLREAIRINNLGAERFASGELGPAMEAYRQALSFVPANEPVFAAQRQLPAEGAGNAAEGAPPSSLGVAFYSNNEGSNSSRFFAIENDCEKPFSYCKPLIFTQDLPDTQDGSATFCGVVVFNMALAFDIRAKETSVAQTARSNVHRNKALQLYESAIDLFSKTSNRVDLTCSMAAASNNKARIYFEQCEYERSNAELVRLQAIMTRADRSAFRSDFLEEDDFQGILLNLLLMWPPSVAQAA